MAAKKGKLKETVGWATGDRHVEAEGRAEQEKPAEQGDEETVEETEHEVRREHGDIR